MGEQMAITKPQARVLEFIRSFSQQHGYAPSLREICSGLNLYSVSTANYHIGMLVAAGRIKRQPGRQRALTVVDQVNELDNLRATVTAQALQLVDQESVISLLRSALETSHQRGNAAETEAKALRKQLEGFEQMAAASQGAA